MHVALGWTYRDRRVIQGPVVYCALEGQSGIEARVEAWRLSHLAESASDDIPFFLQPAPLNLVRDYDELIELIRLKLGGMPPAAVIFDTLARSMEGSESDDEAMGRYIRAADAVREALNCAVIVVHHCGHEGSRPRGHSSLLGAADAVISVKKNNGQTIATVEMSKDGKGGDAIASRLEPVTVRHDEDGEITSCIIRPLVAGTEARGPIKPVRLSAATQIALDALKEALTGHGTVPPKCNHIPDNTLTVRLGVWRRQAYQRDPDGTGDARKRAFLRARQTLQKQGLIGVWASESCAEEDAQCWLIR
jgi:hypothetical protein